mgnify:CR=1 FL=1
MDFTEDPGPRYIRQDKEGGMTSGEAFYLYRLNQTFAQCFNEKKQLVLELDGVSGYPSSFLDEAIGELVYDFTLANVSTMLEFETIMYKKRVAQVKEETLPQWELRRKKSDTVVHSPNLNVTIKVLSEDGKLIDKQI